jgi:hypothetical protein
MINVNAIKVFRKISLTIRSQMLTDIQYIVEEIPIMANSHLLKISITYKLTLITVGWSHIRLRWAKYSMLILMLSSAVQWRESNTFTSIWIRAVIWLYFELKIWMWILFRWITRMKITLLNWLYVSSNEAVWRIFEFSIHQRNPSVLHLVVHLENSQRVYFMSETTIDRAINPPKTTLTEFFELCNHTNNFGAFARTILYSEVQRYFTWTPTKKWMPRKQSTPIDAFPGLSKSNALGWVFTVNPRQTE